MDASDCRAGIQGNDLSSDEKMKRMQRKLDFVHEEQRLQSLVMSDAAWNQSETMESFVAFLKTLNSAGEDYWPIVYRRIGLSCPLVEVLHEPVAQPQRDLAKGAPSRFRTALVFGILLFIGAKLGGLELSWWWLLLFIPLSYPAHWFDMLLFLNWDLPRAKPR